MVGRAGGGRHRGSVVGRVAGGFMAGLSALSDSDIDSADGDLAVSDSDSDGPRERDACGNRVPPPPQGQLFASLFRNSRVCSTQPDSQARPGPAAQPAPQADAQPAPQPAPHADAPAAAQGDAQAEQLFILSTCAPDLDGCVELKAVRERVNAWSAERGFSVSQVYGSQDARKASFRCHLMGRKLRASDCPSKQECLPEESRRRRVCKRGAAGERLCPFL